MCELYLGNLSAEDTTRLYKVSFGLRTLSEKALSNADNLLFTTHTYGDLKKMLDDPEPSLQDKFTLLLKHLCGITEHPGQVKEFDLNYDYSVVCAKNSHEAKFYFESLVEQRLVIREQPFGEQYNPRFKVSADGWKELCRIEQSGAESPNVFIAMWFDKDRAPFEHAINQAAKAAGYLPIRVDRLEHVNRIDDEIISRIRSSRFLIADLTGHRNGVYFEAGFMLGLNRPVIWVCEETDLKNHHFDTRQYNTIAYVDTADLQKRLQFRIEAILGKGPHAES